MTKITGKKEELYKSLLRKITELSRKPTFKEVEDDKTMANPNDFAYYYGSFSAALEKAWGEYSSQSNKIKLKRPIC